MNPSELAADLARRAADAGDRVAELGADRKNAALLLAADRLEAAEASLLEANRLDLEAARERGLEGAPVERLRLPAHRGAMLQQVGNGGRRLDRFGHFLNVRRW